MKSMASSMWMMLMQLILWVVVGNLLSKKLMRVFIHIMAALR